MYGFCVWCVYGVCLIVRIDCVCFCIVCVCCGMVCKRFVYVLFCMALCMEFVLCVYLLCIVFECCFMDFVCLCMALYVFVWFVYGLCMVVAWI